MKVQVYNINRGIFRLKSLVQAGDIIVDFDSNCKYIVSSINEDMTINVIYEGTTVTLGDDNNENREY